MNKGNGKHDTVNAVLRLKCTRATSMVDNNDLRYTSYDFADDNGNSVRNVVSYLHKDHPFHIDEGDDCVIVVNFSNQDVLFFGHPLDPEE